LEDFLDPQDESKTVEGYPAPKRVYIKAKKKI
jgi:tRNA (mo5U34)-methyltransferase